ncbi:MAG: ABC transporter transmembrane domain-containing protein [Microvirga sp.]
MADAPSSTSNRPKAALGALRPLVPYALHYKGRIAAAMGALLVASAATLVLPIAVRRVVDHGFSEGSGYLVNAYFEVLIVVVAALALASALRYYFVVTLGERVVADLRAAVFGHLTRLDPAFFDASKSGEIISRLTADATQVKSAFGISVSLALRNLVLFTGAIALMVLTSPKLSALVLIAIPAIVLPLVLAGRGVRRRARAAQDRLADASAYAAEAVGAVRAMQAFGMERFTAGRFAAASEEAYGAARASITARAILTGIAIFLTSASVVGVLWYGAQDVLAGHMTAGRLSQFVLYAVLAASALGQLSEVYGELAQAAGAAERLGEILAARPSIAPPSSPRPLPEPPLGTVAFEDVRFAYPARPEGGALDDVTFSVRAGERVALVGPSGAGKTTVLQLLLRFYDPQAGRVLVDGVPVEEADPVALRRRLALVPQEPAIFAASVLDNIRYGKPGAGEAEVARAAKLAHADAFIRALPQSYATQIGERGVTLSGGQRQRIAIARAIALEPQFIVLDEPTSALDMSVQAQIVELLRDLQRRKKLAYMFISHDLKVVRALANHVVVMQDGKVVEEGSAERLFAEPQTDYTRALFAAAFKLEIADAGVVRE